MNFKRHATCVYKLLKQENELENRDKKFNIRNVLTTNDNFIIEFFDLTNETVEKRNCNSSENLKVYEVLTFYF